MWVPGPLAATMNLFAAVHARFTGVPVVDGPEAATHVHLTPARLRRLLHDGVDLAGRHLVVAGDRLDPALADRAARAGARTSHYYGAAELSFVAWGRDATDLRPFPGVDVGVREGTVWVRSRYLCTAVTGSRGPFRRDGGFASVGDRGWWDGSRLVVHGRGDDAVTVGGTTVLVADVEAVLRPVAHGEVVAVGLPHADLGQLVAVALTDASEFPRVRAAARSVLQGAARPRLWFAVDELPLTTAGKLDRAALVRLLVSREPGVQALT